MNQLRRTFFALTTIWIATLSWAADRRETLRAINMVENPTNQTGFGSRGELGPYQFRPATWKSYTKRSFKLANDRAMADEVAIKHYEWLKKRLTDAGIDASTYNIAMAWNCGITAVVNGRIPLQTYHYAERVENLATTYAASNKVESDVEMLVIRKEQDKQSAYAMFNLSTPSEKPDFRIAEDPIKFRIAGSVPKFVLPPVGSQMFVFSAN